MTNVDTYENYKEQEHKGLAAAITNAMRDALTNPPKGTTINLTVNINYASGGGATVNVRNG